MENKQQTVGIAGMGFYFPETRVDTKEEAEKAELPEKVYKNINIKYIYKPSDTDHPGKMAYEACVNALKDAEMSPDEIDLIIVTGFMRDYLYWQQGGLLKHKLKANRAITTEVTGGCATFFQAAELAVDQIRGSSDINTVLITSGERLFGYGWPSFLSSGGQAVILKRGCEQFNYLGFATDNYIIHHNLAHIPYGGTKTPFTPETDWNDGGFVRNLIMDKDMYIEHIKPVVFNKFVGITEKLLERTGKTRKDLDYLITIIQQGNFCERIQDAIGMPDIANAYEYAVNLGHFSGADTYILLDKARKDGKIKKDDLILKIGFGGVAWFAALIKY